MLMELIKNIKSLTKIQLRQNKNLVVVAISALALCMLISNLGLIFNHNGESTSLFISINNIIPGILFLILLAIIPISTNMLTNKKISMYPSTGISRFASRILADHICILIILGFTFLMYCIEYPILMAISAGGSDMVVSFAFDIKYALVGTINVLSYYLLAYGVSVLMYCIATKLGVIKSIFFYIGFFMIVIFLFKSNIITFIGIRDYFGEERYLGMYVYKTWSIWFITMIISFLVASSTKTIKEELRGIRFVVCIAIIGCFIVTAFLPLSSRSSKNFGNISIYSSASKFNELKETNIYKETVVKCDAFNRDKIAALSISPQIYFMTETEAMKGGILENDSSLKGEIVVVTFFPDEKYNNQYIYQYYLDNMTISCKNSIIDYSFSNTKTVINFLWGDSYKFLDSYDLEYSGVYPDINEKSVMIIAPESVMIN
ncbi:hypothetical protein [[Clostridium] fimetarium]|uniref:Uncharacterized protein n=1 Tax=[Clostridium] fimetarium TaxID=99656 RepID=A0A1I0R754_9FIRM|nr:hypothetical protein [[Clostridium] fimetarium]SEW36500.1 hypothetical protein SAMN05421659_112100 [[Clostridium] fimetarium]